MTNPIDELFGEMASADRVLQAVGPDAWSEVSGEVSGQFLGFVSLSDGHKTFRAARIKQRGKAPGTQLVYVPATRLNFN